MLPSWGTGRSTRLDGKLSARGELTTGSDSAGRARQEAEKLGTELGAWPGRKAHRPERERGTWLGKAGAAPGSRALSTRQGRRRSRGAVPGSSAGRRSWKPSEAPGWGEQQTQLEEGAGRGARGDQREATERQGGRRGARKR
jgi:hypothetical protein